MHDIDLLRLFTIYTCRLGLQHNVIRLMMIVERHGHVDQALSLLQKRGCTAMGS